MGFKGKNTEYRSEIVVSKRRTGDILVRERVSCGDYPSQKERSSWSHLTGYSCK